MKKYVISIVLLLTAQLQADEILSDNSRELSQREWHSVSLSKEWLNNGNKSFRKKGVTHLYNGIYIIIYPIGKWCVYRVIIGR